MSDRAKAIFGFAAAAGVLILLADTAPKIALGFVGVLGLGVALGHASEIADVLNTWTKAVGGSGT
jgi:hypothetical protein